MLSCGALPSFPIHIDFGWRADAPSLQPLRTGSAVVTLIYSSLAHNDVHVWRKILTDRWGCTLLSGDRTSRPCA